MVESVVFYTTRSFGTESCIKFTHQDGVSTEAVSVQPIKPRIGLNLLW